MLQYKSPQAFSPHGKVPWGHTDAGGDEGARVSSISSLRPCVHGQQQAHFPHEILGYNCEDPSLERGQVPRLGTSLACGRILPQSKPVRALSDPCGPLLFMLGIHTATPESQWKESAPLERRRRTATQKSHAVSTHETVNEFSKSGSYPVASLRVPSRRVGRLDGPLVHGGELTSMPKHVLRRRLTLQNSRIIRYCAVSKRT